MLLRRWPWLEVGCGHHISLSSDNTDFNVIGALFGFDISSMSAIISTEPYLCYFNQGPLYMATDGKCSGPTDSVQGQSSCLLDLRKVSSDPIYRWHHRSHAWRLIPWGPDFWLHFRFLWTKESYPNRLLDLVRWTYNCLRLSEYRHVDRGTCDQWPGCWDLLSPSACLHLRDCTTFEARTARRFSTM